MRRRQPPPGPVTGQSAVLMPKPNFEETFESVWSDAQSADGWGRTWKLHGHRIFVEIFVGTRVRCRMSVDSHVVLGFEHHARASDDLDGGRCPAGYHWDLHPPLQRGKVKIPAAIGSASEREVLSHFLELLSVRLQPDTQESLE